MAEWWRRRSSASTSAANKTYVVSTFVLFLPSPFFPDKGNIILRNPDGTAVPKDPANPLRGSYTIPVPVERIVFPAKYAAGDNLLSIGSPSPGPVALAPFMDVGINPIVRVRSCASIPGN